MTHTHSLPFLTFHCRVFLGFQSKDGGCVSNFQSTDDSNFLYRRLPVDVSIPFFW